MQKKSRLKPVDKKTTAFANSFEELAYLVLSMNGNQPLSGPDILKAAEECGVRPEIQTMHEEGSDEFLRQLKASLRRASNVSVQEGGGHVALFESVGSETAGPWRLAFEPSRDWETYRLRNRGTRPVGSSARSRRLGEILRKGLPSGYAVDPETGAIVVPETSRRLISASPIFVIPARGGSIAKAFGEHGERIARLAETDSTIYVYESGILEFVDELGRTHRDFGPALVQIGEMTFAKHGEVTNTRGPARVFADRSMDEVVIRDESYGLMSEREGFTALKRAAREDGVFLTDENQRVYIDYAHMEGEIDRLDLVMALVADFLERVASEALGPEDDLPAAG